LLILNNVSKFYQKNAVLNNVTYHFDCLKYCIVGPNGIGKTTLLMLAAGLENLNCGEIFFNEESVCLVDTKRHLGISSDKIKSPDFLTAQQLLDFHCSQHDCPFPNTLIEHLGFRAQLATQVSDLSLGSLKKVSLLLALAHQPKCLLLDEPTTGLDNRSREWLLDFLGQYAGQVIVTSHEKIFTESAHYKLVDFEQLNKYSETI
jgi:ABC-type multidrug transport system ATPase subunit